MRLVMFIACQIVLLLCGTNVVHGNEIDEGRLESALIGEDEVTSPIMMEQLGPASTQTVDINIQGTFQLIPARDKSRYSLSATNVINQIANKPQFTLPVLSFDLVQNAQNELIPVKRELQVSQHDYWDYFVGVGKIGIDQLNKGYYRIALPLSLVEKNQNCVHNGVVTFLVDQQSQALHFYYQFSSETCAYFKPDLWGVGQVAYQPSKIDGALRIIQAYQHERSLRMTSMPLATLADNITGLKLSQLMLQSSIQPAEMSRVGVVYQGVHYVSNCTTRMGDYPFCQQQVLPSYSTAKSVFAGLTMLYLEQRFGDVFEQPVSKWVEACDTKTWQGVTLADLLNMTTGHYGVADYGADEASAQTLVFFDALTHQDKIRFSCQHYARQSAPGQQFVYHTSDTYLLGTALSHFIKQRIGKSTELFKDILVDKVLADVPLSPVFTQTRTTADAIQQPFVGYGLFYTADDIAQISQFIQRQTQLSQSKALLAQPLLSQSLQRTGQPSGNVTEYDYIRYSNGFWARNFTNQLGCKHSVWLPFMSGFGGITVALLPNQLTYYYFSDTHQYNWASAVSELNKIKPICQ